MLFNNQLTGPMPGWINSLNHLFYLDVSNNSLTGKIPMTLMEIPMLKSDKTVICLDPSPVDLLIYLIPSSLQYHMGCAWPGLLNLGENKFTGVMPR
jgi:hypothetical protein